MFCFEKKVEIYYTHIIIDVPFRYDDEYLDSKLRTPSVECALNQIPLYTEAGCEQFDQNNYLDYEYRLFLIVDAQTGKIINLNEGVKITESITNLKVCDEGTYSLLNEGKIVASKSDYVPEFLGPCEEYGDYINLRVVDNIITNWDFDPNLVSSYFWD